MNPGEQMTEGNEQPFEQTDFFRGRGRGFQRGSRPPPPGPSRGRGVFRPSFDGPPPIRNNFEQQRGLMPRARAPPPPYRGTPPNAGPPRPPSYPPGVRPPMRSPSLPFRGPPPNAGPPRPPSYPPGVRPPIRTPFPSPRAPQPNSFPQRTSIPSSVQPPIPPDQKNEQLQLANTEPVSQSNSPPIRLTEAEQQLFEDLMAASKCRNDPRRNEFIRLLQAFRDNNPDLNQYKTILALVTKDPFYRKTQRTSFIDVILESFEFWLKRENVREDFKEFLTLELQMLAFGKFWFVDQSFIFNRVAKIFELESVKSDIKPVVANLLKSRKDFKRGCEIIMALGLHDDFSLEEVTIPMTISSSSSMLVESFLDGSKHHQVKMLQWLDSLTEQSQYSTDTSLTQNYPQIQDLNTSRLSGVPLGKFIKKLLNKYNLDPKIAAKHLKMKTVGDFRYLIGEKTSMTMRKENWRDLVHQKAKDDRHLQSLLFKYLTEGRVTGIDIPEAIFWSKKFEIPRSELPFLVTQELEKIESGISIKEDDDFWDTEESSLPTSRFADLSVAGAPAAADDWFSKNDFKSDEYLELDIPVEKIEIIDSKKKFLDFSKEIRLEYVVGLDCEFLPKCVVAKDTAAILQLATMNKTYILDFLSLRSEISDEDLAGFVQKFFVEGAHVILGYGLNGDLHVLANTHQAFHNIPDRSINLLDLDWFSKLLTTGSFKLFELPNKTVRKGLSGLSEMALGKPLDKRDQISDWSKRPLTKEQLLYAALDAKVLVMIYDKIQTLAEDLGKHEQMSKLESTLKKNRNKPPKAPYQSKYKKAFNNDSKGAAAVGVAAKQEEQQAPRPASKPIKPDELRIVCDSMLLGLRKGLSYDGVDAVAIEPFESVDTCGHRGQDENRKILTRGMKRYSVLARFVAPGSCLAIKSDILEEQLKEVWTHFNVTFGDDFTSCESCGCTECLILPSSIVLKVSNNLARLSPVTAGSRYHEEEYDDFGDEVESDDDLAFAVPVKKPGEDCAKLDDGTEIDLRSGKTKAGLKLNIAEIPASVVYTKEKFFGCRSCGQMSWVKI